MTKSRGILARRRPWSDEEIALLRRDYPHKPTDELARAFGRKVYVVYSKAKKLGLNKTAEYLASPAACRLRRGDNVGAAYRFKKGQAPANKGLRRPGWSRGRMRETQFKRGQLPKNYLPIGSLRVNSDGYLDRKISETGYGPRDWKSVHRIVWEEAHGPVPAAHAVAFKSGRRTADVSKITLDALELVTRQELMLRNSYHNNYPPEIGRLIQLRGALQRQIKKRERSEKQD